MTDSYNTVAIKFARLGWKIFSTDVADSAQGTEVALTNIENTSALGALVGDMGDTVLEMRVNGENGLQYFGFNDGNNQVIYFPGTGSDIGSQLVLKSGRDFPAFKVDSGYALVSCGAAS
jgi:hypothetical protein